MAIDSCAEDDPGAWQVVKRKGRKAQMPDYTDELRGASSPPLPNKLEMPKEHALLPGSPSMGSSRSGASNNSTTADEAADLPLSPCVQSICSDNSTDVPTAHFDDSVTLEDTQSMQLSSSTASLDANATLEKQLVSPECPDMEFSKVSSGACATATNRHAVLGNAPLQSHLSEALLDAARKCAQKAAKAKTKASVQALAKTPAQPPAAKPAGDVAMKPLTKVQQSDVSKVKAIVAETSVVVETSVVDVPVANAPSEKALVAKAPAERAPSSQAPSTMARSTLVPSTREQKKQAQGNAATMSQTPLLTTKLPVLQAPLKPPPGCKAPTADLPAPKAPSTPPTAPPTAPPKAPPTVAHRVVPTVLPETPAKGAPRKHKRKRTEKSGEAKEAIACEGAEAGICEQIDGMSLGSAWLHNGRRDDLAEWRLVTFAPLWEVRQTITPQIPVSVKAIDAGAHVVIRKTFLSFEPESAYPAKVRRRARSLEAISHARSKV